jgi:hypothetical protein
MRNSLALLGIPDLPIRAFRHVGDRRIQPQKGGGGIPIVDEALDAGGDFVDSVSDAAADLDDTVNEEIPGGWATVVNVATAGQAAPYTSAAQAAIALDKGADLEDVARNYAISQAAGEVSSGVGASTGSQLAGNVAGSTASGVLRGKSLEDSLESGLKSGAISSGISAGAKEISDADFERWSQEQAEKSYENAPSPTELDVMAADNTVALPPATTTTETGPGYYNEATGEFVSDPSGGLQAPLDNTSGTNLDSMKDYKYDIATNTWTSPDGEVVTLNDLSNAQTPLDTSSMAPTGTPSEAYDPVNAKPALKLAANTALQQAAADKAAADRAAAIKAAQANKTTESNNILGLLALLDTKAPQAPVQKEANNIKYFYDIMGSDILPPTPEKIENPVFDFAEGGTIEDLIRMLRS